MSRFSNQLYSLLFQGLLTDSFKAEDNFDENDVRSENPKLSGDAFPTYFRDVGAAQGLCAEDQKAGKEVDSLFISTFLNYVCR